MKTHRSAFLGWTSSTLAILLLCATTGRAQNVIAWGDDSQGQTDVPPSATNVVAVAAGASNSLALRADGTLIIWGSTTTVPYNITNATAIAAGAAHNLALLANGTVLAWGNNTYGQITVPPSATNVVAIAAGDNHTLALQTDGRIVAWGRGTLGQTNIAPIITNIVAIAAGGDRSLALRGDGECFIWGKGYYSATGTFRYLTDSVAISAGDWQQVALSAAGLAVGQGARVPPSVTNLLFVSCSSNYSLGLSADGSAVAWGNNSLTNLPPTATNLIAIAAGPFHCLAVAEDSSAPQLLRYRPAYQTQSFPTCRLPLFAPAVGNKPLSYQWLADGVPILGADTPLPGVPAVLGTDSVQYQVVVSNAFGSLTSAVATVSIRPLKAWGSDTSGQTQIPATLNNPNTVAVAAGEHHCLALSSNGLVSAWGQNQSGQASVPPATTSIVAIAAGGKQSLALKDNGSVIAWGLNGNGQTNPPLSANNIVAISAGWAHSLALRADGTVIAWGDDECGQAGVALLARNVIAIASGYWHNMVLQSDGTVVTSGLDYTVPQSVTNVVAIAAGWETCLALRSDGSVIAWGENSHGQCNVPPQATNVVAISSGYYHSMAQRADGSVVAWGMEYCGSTIIPAGMTQVGAIAAGGEFNMAIAGTGPPRFSRQLTSIVARESGQAVLSAKIQGKYPMHLQWLLDGSAIPDATNRFLLVRPLQSANSGNYTLVASNEISQVSSSPINLIVNQGAGPVSGIAEWREAPYGRQDSTSQGTRATCSTAAGGFHRLALSVDGTVAASGKNADGQLNVPPEATNVVAIAAGRDHSLALRDDGRVFAWGRNWDNQTNVPPTATNIVSLAAGWAHSLGLRADGTVVAWGNNEYGQTSVSCLAMEVVAIAAGYYHNLALRTDGRVVAWGFDEFVPPEATNIVAIAAGWGHSLALSASGRVLAWGDNTYGQIDVPANATNIVTIAAGFYHSVALRADGSLIAWGNGNFEVPAVPEGMPNVASLAAGEDYNLVLAATGRPQLGRPLRSVIAHAGGQTILQVPVQATYPASYQWFHEGVPVDGATNLLLVLTGIQSAAAGNYVLVVSNGFDQASSSAQNLVVLPNPVTQTVVGAWGDDSKGQCDIPPALMDSRAIAAGAFHSLALQADGTVVAWGKNDDGQTNVPPAATNIVAVAAGGYHSLALRDNGSVLAWGGNWDGQTNVPSTATNLVAIAAGSAHSLALSRNGTVLAWGNNDLRQTNIPTLTRGVVAIAAGYYHNLALLSDHTIVAWGLQNTVPASATNVVAISGGWWHSLALRADGSVIAWGDNSYGQCTVPPAATNVVGIAAGYYHSLALLANGTVIVWGAGINGVTNVLTGLGNVARIAAGQDYSLVMVELGPPRFNRGSGALVANAGGKATFVADVSGTSPLALQWYHDGASVEGATSRFLLLTNAPLSDSGTYTLLATNIKGLTNSLDFSLAVQSAPAVAGNPSPQNVLLGTHFCLNADVSGLEPLLLQWRLNGVDLQDGPRLSGATNKVLCLAGAKSEDSGSYSLVASNAYGSVTGLVAQVSVSSILAWGDNSARQLNVPTGTTDVVTIAAGGDHGLALRADDSIVPWGDNSSGQSNLPQPGGNIVAVADGGSHTLALRSDGTVVAWGDNSYGQTNVPSFAGPVVAVAAGGFHSLALLSNGSVVAWGSNASLQESVPVSATNVLAIAAGDAFSLAVRSDGTLLGWGALPPVPAAATSVVAIAAGARHALALRADGALIAWGGNYYDQSSVPDSATNIVAIAAGGDNSVALLANGTVVCWGADYFGQASAPPSATNVLAISAGTAHSLAQVGDGTQRPSLQPLSRAATIGQPVILNAGSLIGGVASYQWQLNGLDLTGATNAALAIPSATWTNAGVYRVVARNLFGSVTGPTIVLTVMRTPLWFDTAPGGIVVSNDGTHLRVLGASGVGPVVILTSSDMQAWEPILTNPPAIGAVEFIDPETNNPAGKLYRALEGTTAGPLRIDIQPLLSQTGSSVLPIQLTGLTANGPVIIYASSNLLDWSAIFTNPPTVGPLQYLEAPPTGQPVRFYRASEYR